MIEDMLAYRGIIVTYKPLYEWAEKFGQTFANNIQCRRPRLGYKWHLDECVISIKGEHYILWRSVDQDGFVLDVLVQKRHNTKAAKLFMRKLVSAQRCALRVMVTDKLRSYGTAKQAIGLSVCDHRQHKGLNNRAENSHQPIRRRKRVMKRFKSAKHVQSFTSIHDPIYNLNYSPPETNSMSLTIVSYGKPPQTCGAKSLA